MAKQRLDELHRNFTKLKLKTISEEQSKEMAKHEFSISTDNGPSTSAAAGSNISFTKVDLVGCGFFIHYMFLERTETTILRSSSIYNIRIRRNGGRTKGTELAVSHFLFFKVLLTTNYTFYGIDRKNRIRTKFLDFKIMIFDFYLTL